MEMGERRHLGRRIFIALLGIGAIGGLIGMKLFRTAGFRKRAVAAQSTKKQITIRTNPLAVSRMKKEE